MSNRSKVNNCSDLREESVASVNGRMRRRVHTNARYIGVDKERLHTLKSEQILDWFSATSIGYCQSPPGDQQSSRVSCRCARTRRGSSPAGMLRSRPLDPQD